MDTLAGIDTATLAATLMTGDRQAVAQSLNLLDDQRPEARHLAATLLDKISALKAGCQSHLVGITGPPGVGKSSLTAALISVWRQRGKRVGVLAVDPSSPVSGGALLGDRLRMKTSSEDDGVFVRSLSSRGDFGGLSPQVWPMSLAMLAAFDIVVVETVGVGQREIDVAQTCDTTCFIAQPGSGDSVQFLKAGILEIPDLLVVNKEDMGDVARRTLNELRTTLGNSQRSDDWRVPVLATSATHNIGITELADALAAHRHTIEPDLQQRRSANQAQWVAKRIIHAFGQSGLDKLGGADALQQRLVNGTDNPFTLYDALHDTLTSTLSGNNQT
ncbi:MAG: LAO/AO transport system kinase [Bacteroidia bacterium]